MSPWFQWNYFWIQKVMQALEFVKGSYSDRFVDIFLIVNEPKFALKFFHCEYTKVNSRQQPLPEAGKTFYCQFFLFLFGGPPHFYCDTDF